MKIIKKFSLLMVLVLSVSLFSGCSKDEIAFRDALMKNQDILSMESVTNMGFTISSSGLSEEEQAMFDNVATILNNSTLALNQKAQANKELTKSKGQIDATIKLPDMSFTSSVWVDMDFDKENPVFQEIIQIPTILAAALPEEYQGKEYMVLDFNTMNNAYAEMGVQMDFNKILEIAMRYQEKFTTTFKEYLKDFDPQLTTVSKLEDKTINGESLQIYQVKLDDTSFKQFLQYLITDLMKDEKVIPLFMEYMKEIMATTGETIPKEMDFTQNFAENIPELIVKINNFFDILKEIPLLNENGIQIEYAINKDGYIVQETGTMGFVVDVEKYATAFSKLSSEEMTLPVESAPTFNFEISYDSTISNINKNIEISIPEITAENSVDYMEFLMSMIPSPAPEGTSPSALIFVDDVYVETTGEVEFVNNRIFIPLRDVSTALGAELQWNQATKEITIIKGSTELIFKVGSKLALQNGNEVTLDSEVYLSNGISMVPLRFLSESLGYSINWTPEIRLVEILSPVE